MVMDIVGLHQRTDTIKEDRTQRLRAVNLLVGDVVTAEEGTTGKAADGARGRRGQHHHVIDMPDTTAMAPGSEVQGLL